MDKKKIITYSRMSESNQLRKAIFYDQILGYIDIEFLKKSYHQGYLKDAHIMARLFNLVEETQFSPQPMDIDQEDCLTLFRSLHVCWEEWSLLLSFLKRGDLKVYQQYPDKILKCYDLSLKLGGIPNLEDYYHQFLEKFPEKEFLSNSYNPLNPEEDIYQIYNWGICINGNSEGKNITQLVGHNNYTFYHRKLKNEIDSVN